MTGRDSGAGFFGRYFSLWLYLPALAALGTTAAVAVATDTPIAAFMQDPAAVLAGHPFTGFVSNVGVLGWCVSAAVSVFAWLIVRAIGGDRELGAMLLMGGILTTVLLLDDLFMLHEEIFPTRLGISQQLVIANYGVATLAFLLRFRRTILETRVGLLAGALLLFGLSTVLDQIEVVGPTWPHFLEDGAKFLGIVGWLGYFVVTSRSAILDAAARPSDEPDDSSSG